MISYIWLAVIAIFVVIEGMTMGLTTIWFAGGAFFSFLLSLFDVPWPVQIAVFIIASIVLLVLTRPIAVKYLNVKKSKTNYDGIIGKVAKVTEKVDNYNTTGVVTFNGQQWSARANSDSEIYEPGSLVKVLNISGVKVIVTKYVED